MEFLVYLVLVSAFVVLAAIVWNNVWLPYKRKVTEANLKSNLEHEEKKAKLKAERLKREEAERELRNGINIQSARRIDEERTRKKYGDYTITTPKFNRKKPMSISEMMLEQEELQRQKAAQERKHLEDQLLESQALNRRLRQEAALRKQKQSNVRVNPRTGLWEHVEDHLNKGETFEAALEILEHTLKHRNK